MTEAHRVAGRRLGRRKPTDKPVLRLGAYLTGAVPAHPTVADHFAAVADWGLYGNDRYGDCGPTSVANSRKLTTRYLSAAEQSPSQTDVFDLYRRSGNPDFDPTTDADDNGVDMKTMLSAVVKGGIGGVKGAGFAAVDTGNLDEVRAAIAIFGFVLLGVNLETAQQTQTDGGLWDYKRSGLWGGHAVLAGLYTSDGQKGQSDVSVVTWAEVVGTTDAFWAHQVEEAYVVIWPEHLGSKAFLEGVDQQALASDFQALTGRPFPVQPAPVPVPPAPVPGVDAADQALAASMKTWLTAKGLD